MTLRAAAGVYAGVTLLPLFVVLIGPTVPERGFWIEFGVALGFIGLATLGLQSVLTARYPRISATLGQDTLLQFHRQAGLVAFTLVLAHPVILITSDGSYWKYLDPTDNFLRAVFLWIVVVALPAIIALSLWREQLRLPYEWWRVGHGALAVLIVTIGLVHIYRVRYYLENPWKQALWISIGSASIASVLYVRAVKPLRVRKMPYRVTSVESIARQTWSVTLVPDSPRRLRFRAGQFAFATFADCPFSLEQHPFSFASSATDTDRLEFAIKELGDFTERVGDLPVGSRVYVDGPYGSLHLPPATEPGICFVAGGIGISPIMSMLRTARDEHRAQPLVLVYANKRPEDTAYVEEITEIATELDLRVLHVLSEPPPSWDGAVGGVTDSLLATALGSESVARWRHVLCGPPGLMELAERALLDHGAPLRNIASERFDLGNAREVGERARQVRRLVLGLAVTFVAAAALFAW